MYKTFKTDPVMEAKGVIIDYGDFRVTVARSGGGNKRFARIAQIKTKPLRRAIQTETLSVERSLELTHEIFAEAVVLNWEVQEDGKWKQGIEAEDGSTLKFTKENVVGVFKALPDLFTDIQKQSEMASLFRETILEEDTKN